MVAFGGQANTSGVYYLNTISVRMFSPSVDRHMIQCNEYGEYEVAKGVPSRLFAAILVSCNYCQEFVRVKRMLAKNNGCYKQMCLSITSPYLVASDMVNIPGN